MKNIMYGFYISFFFIFSLHSLEHWIFIHGTFSAKNPWHAPESETHNTLKKSLTEKNIKGAFYIHSFVWSGKNNHKARMQAAHELIFFLKKIIKESPSYTQTTFHIIGHSHGATVALIAADYLHQTDQKIKIHELFCLGVPIYTSWYQQADKKIGSIYNIFSYGDGIQPLGGIFKRVFPESFTAYNIQVVYDFKCPCHTKLHDPKLIACLPKFYILKKYFDHEIILHIKKHPEKETHDIYLAADLEREKDLMIDKAFTNQIMGLYSETRRKLLKRNKISYLTSENIIHDHYFF